MAVKRSRRKPSNWRASELLKALMADRGRHAIDLERESERPGVGHPMRSVSGRTVYRVTTDGFVPLAVAQFEIAATFGLLPSHIWGMVPLPEPYAYLNAGMTAMAVAA